MNDKLSGEALGGALERLREAARIDLPKLADEYAKVREYCEATKEVDGKLDRPAYFGGTKVKDAWLPLRDLIWTASGDTGDNLWALSQGLGAAVDDFAEQDAAAGNEMRRLKGELETDKDPANDQWKAGYDDDSTPEWKDPGK